ncbi:unnamed protein product [Lathyrus sativus]|nr:unnamed protein product [Lathyrus sativus]
MWTMHEAYEEFIANCWSNPVIGCPMSILNGKLHILKVKLKVCNREVFGNIQNNTKVAKENLDNVQDQLTLDSNNAYLRKQETKVQLDLETLISREEMF